MEDKKRSRLEWFRAWQKNQSTNDIYFHFFVCELHFTEEQIVVKNKNKQLVCGAVPSKFPISQFIYQMEITQEQN